MSDNIQEQNNNETQPQQSLPQNSIEQKQQIIQSFELGKDYLVPSWTSKPTKQYYFEVIKAGIQIELTNLKDKDFMLIGKYSDISDIVLEHPSISRKHAILQHKNNGELFLYDLNSTHGTFVNNRKLPGKVYHKLNPFDTIKFGASTRNFILRCEELEKEQQEMQELAYKHDSSTDDKGKKEISNNDNQAESTQKKSMRQIYLDMLENDPYFKQLHKPTSFSGGPENQKKKFKGRGEDDEFIVDDNNDKDNDGGEDENGITWGMIDEQEIYDFQDPDDVVLEPDLLRRLPGLTEKQIDKIAKYEEKLNKYRQIENELDDIISKEKKEFGLDEKVKLRKEKLQSKVQEALSQLEQAEDNVKLVVLGEQKETEEDGRTKRKKIQMELDHDQDSFEGDEFYDRTKKKVKTEENEKKQIVEVQRKTEMNTEMYWSLKKKLEILIKERHQCNLKLIDNQVDKGQIQDQSQQLTQQIAEDEDELEKFMSKTNSQLQQEAREIILKKLVKLNQEIDEVTETLKYVKPEIQNNIEQFEKQLQTFDEKDKIKQQNQSEKDDKNSKNKNSNQWIENEEEEDDDEQNIEQNKLRKTNFQIPQNRITQTLQSIKQLSQQRKFDNSENLTDEQIIEETKKELARQKKYYKQKKDEDELQEELMEDYQKDIELINQANLNKSQKVFDITKNKQVKGKVFKH